MSEQFTVGDMQRMLDGCDPDTPLEFGGGLTFYRFKGASGDHMLLEWAEIQAPLGDSFKEKYPEVQVVYFRRIGLEEGEVIREVSLPWIEA